MISLILGRQGAGMIKNDLILTVEKETNLSHSRAVAVVEAIINIIKKGLVEDGEVRIRGFGSFRVVNKKTGYGRDIRRQRRLVIGKGKRIKFCCGQELKTIALRAGAGTGHRR